MDTLDKIFQEIELHIPELEAERLHVNNKQSKIRLFSYLIIVLILIAIVMVYGIGMIPFALILFIIYIFNFYSESKKIYSNFFKQRFKSKIIKTIIKEFNPGLNYISDNHITMSEFLQSKLFAAYPKNYNGEDYISGNLGGTEFRLSELWVKEENQGGEKEKGKTIFEGVFLVADFHKYFHSETYILPESELKAVGLNKRTHEGAELIVMENEKFEKAFRVFTTSDQDARYILSPSMMERILELQYKYDNKVSISFRGSNVYIALSTNRDFFEHDMSQPVDEKSLIRGHLNDLEKMLATIDELNLNTRIWSKMPKKVERKNYRS